MQGLVDDNEFDEGFVDVLSDSEMDLFETMGKMALI